MQLWNFEDQKRKGFVRVQFGVRHLIDASPQTLHPAGLGQSGSGGRV
jgi:hypothetical protein